MPDVVTRFAPSPSGRLHIGGARTALFCWAFARRHGGRFLLRIEDTDRARSSDEATRAILQDLAWLGIEWDEGPVLDAGDRVPGSVADPVGGRQRARIGGDPRSVGPFEQSNRLHLYDEAIERLIERDSAYHAFDDAESLEAQRKAAAARKETYRYDRAALRIPRAERVARAKAGEPHVVRLLAPDEPVRVVDEVLGEVSFAAGEVDDLVLRKADGYPTYHFAVVVDDERMGVTHVLRGQEHLMNTPRHVLIQRALGCPTPVYAHMPLIFNERGSKMSKRERDQTARQAVKAAALREPPTPAIGRDEFDAWLADSGRQLEQGQLEALAAAMRLALPEVSVEDFRRAGYLPEVVTNFIALLGWTPPRDDEGRDRERFDMAFLAREFDVARIGKSNARFDRAKLMAFNQVSIAAMERGEFARAWKTWIEQSGDDEARRVLDLAPAAFELACAMAQPRARTLAEAHFPLRYALLADEGVEFDAAAVKKHLHSGEPRGVEVLASVRAALAGVEPFEPAAIEAAVRAVCEARGVGMGKAAQPIRVAVTGSAASPGLGETLALLGRSRTLARIDRCLAAHAG